MRDLLQSHGGSCGSVGAQERNKCSVYIHDVGGAAQVKIYPCRLYLYYLALVDNSYFTIPGLELAGFCGFELSAYGNLLVMSFTSEVYIGSKY